MEEQEKKLNIVSIVSEVAPFSKTGGLADVGRSLPKAIKRLGHDVSVITPFYEKLIDKKKHNLELIYENVEIRLNSKEKEFVNFWKGYLMEDLPVYFVQCPKYFSKRKTLYLSGKENARFLVFDVACLKLLNLLDAEPDIIHCHDRQTGLIPFYLKTNFHYSNEKLKKAKTLFTIHNLVFQMGMNWWDVPLEKKDYGRKRLPHLADDDGKELEYVNFVKRAILTSDAINTVSEQYKEEIMTKKFGQDLDRILRNRKDRLFGIVNGIDYNAYNPSNDPGLFRNYDFQSFHFKKENKRRLQKHLGLKVDDEIPMLCATSRVTFQKGFELILKVLKYLLTLDIQIVIMGDGDSKYINQLKKFHKKFPKKIIWLPFTGNSDMETLLYAASDLFLLPSHHEPCGINQLIAMRYGCIPIVREVGGLYDTVENYDSCLYMGNGFTFKRFNEIPFYGAVIRALENFKNKDEWYKLVKHAMQQSYSWEIPAKKYIELYRAMLDFNGQK